MSKNRGAGLLVVLTLAMGIGPLINVGLSATSSLVIEGMNISAGQFGLLATVCFAVSALGSMSLGRLSDRIAGRLQLLIIFGSSALALLLASLSPNYGWLLAAMVLAGISQAMSNPTTNRMIALHAPAGKQAQWIGIKQSGLQANQVFAGAVFPALALLIGWQGAAGVCAALAVALLLWVWNRLPAEPPAALRRPVPARVSHGPGARAAGTLRRPGYGSRVWLYAVQACLASVGVTATNVYLPLFAHRGLGFSLVAGGLTTAIVGAVGVVSRVFWARKMAAGSGANSLLLLLAAGSVLGAVMFLLAGSFHHAPLLWAGVVLHGTMALGINVVIMAGVMRDVPAAAAGGATGVVSAGMFLGIALGPLMMGLLLDATGGFVQGWLFVAVLNGVCVLLAGALWLRMRG